MTRRGLFGIIGAALAGATLDPERLLWVPGKKLVSIPKPGPKFVRVVIFGSGDAAPREAHAAETQDANDLYKARMFEWSHTGKYRTDPLARPLQGPFEVVMPRRELRELHEVVSVWHGSGLWKL